MKLSKKPRKFTVTKHNVQYDDLLVKCTVKTIIALPLNSWDIPVECGHEHCEGFKQFLARSNEMHQFNELP